MRILASHIRYIPVPLLTRSCNIFGFSTLATMGASKLEHIAEITMRQHRRLHLNTAVLNQNKDIVHAEIRQHSDGIIDLKQKGKCPGVIQRVTGKI